MGEPRETSERVFKHVRYYDEAIRRRLAEAGLDSYAALTSRSRDQAIYRTTRTATHRLELPALPEGSPDDPAVVYLKVYSPGRRGWKFLLRPSWAAIEARSLRLMGRWAVPAARVVAVGSHRTWWGLVGAFIMTAEWRNGVPLSDHARATWHPRGAGPAPFRDFLVSARGSVGPDERRDQEQIGRLVAEAVAGMHRRHFYHMDLQWRNVLVRRGAAGDWQIALIDCPRGQRRWSGPGRRHGQLSDLASLDRLAGVYLTRVERLRWLKAYLGAQRCDETVRRLARRVARYRDRFERRRHSRTAVIRRDGKPEPLEG